MQEFYAVSSKRCIGRKKYEKLYAVSKRKSAGVYSIERRKNFENKTKWKNIKKKKNVPKTKQKQKQRNATQDCASICGVRDFTFRVSCIHFLFGRTIGKLPVMQFPFDRRTLLLNLTRRKGGDSYFLRSNGWHKLRSLYIQQPYITARSTFDVLARSKYKKKKL